MIKSMPKTFKVYIIKSHATPKALKLEIITKSPLAQYKEVCKIVKLLNKRKESTTDKYHVLYSTNSTKALNELQERILQNV